MEKSLGYDADEASWDLDRTSFISVRGVWLNSRSFSCKLESNTAKFSSGLRYNLDHRSTYLYGQSLINIRGRVTLIKPKALPPDVENVSMTALRVLWKK